MTAATRTRRDWTAAQAGYHAEVTELATTRSGGDGLPRHYVLTRHGILARTWAGPDFVQVALLRPRNGHATYQGSVQAVPGGWAAFNPDGRQVSAVHNDYMDAEPALLRLRTGHRSTSTYDWPGWMLQCSRPAAA